MNKLVPYVTPARGGSVVHNFSRRRDNTPGNALPGETGAGFSFAPGAEASHLPMSVATVGKALVSRPGVEFFHICRKCGRDVALHAVRCKCGEPTPEIGE